VTGDRRRGYGRRGEWLAIVVCTLHGYRILGRRVRTPAGEVDLVCRRGTALVIVEVKRRALPPPPGGWITPGQIERLHGAAGYLRARERWARSVRVELVTIVGWRVRLRGQI
jgi:putative endonuclease